MAAKPLSRAAALRHAKAAAAAAEQAAAGPTLAPEPDPATLPEAVRRAVADYRPQGVTSATWEPLGVPTRRLVIGYRPTSANNARNVATHTFGLLQWAATRPGRADRKAPLDPVELLTPGLLDAYLNHLAGQRTPDASLASIRAVLRRVLRGLDGAAQPAKIAYQPVAAPYDPASCAHFVRLARHQPTPDHRRSLSFVVGLALGAGLDGRDLRHVSRDGFADLHPAQEVADALAEVGPDRREVAPFLTVTVTGGERPRTVVVRRQYEPLVREALALHDQARRGKRAPVLGRSSTRRNITTPVMESAVTAQADVAVDIEVNRLRATWLVAAMTAAVPLADLLAAAGLRSARTLTDPLPYCPTPDPAQVTAALAALTNHQPVAPVSPGQSPAPSRQVRS